MRKEGGGDAHSRWPRSSSSARGRFLPLSGLCNFSKTGSRSAHLSSQTFLVNPPTHAIPPTPHHPNQTDVCARRKTNRAHSQKRYDSSCESSPISDPALIMAVWETSCLFARVSVITCAGHTRQRSASRPGSANGMHMQHPEEPTPTRITPGGVNLYRCRM